MPSSSQRIKVVAVLACRAQSIRLYAKPLQLVGDRPILKHLIDRLDQVQGIDGMVMAISDGNENLAFVEVANEWGLPYIVGDEEDVLSRYLQAAHYAGTEVVLRVTTENPFIYYENLDELILHHMNTAADLTVCEMLPDGALAEVINVSALERAHEGGGQLHHEHSTLFIFENPDVFKIERIAAPAELARPDIRLTIDTPEDLIVARRIYEALEPEFGPIPPLLEIIKYLDAHEDLRTMNAHLSANSTKLWQ